MDTRCNPNKTLGNFFECFWYDVVPLPFSFTLFLLLLSCPYGIMFSSFYIILMLSICVKESIANIVRGIMTKACNMPRIASPIDSTRFFLFCKLINL